ncbi:MAG: hypothetical protein KAT68_06490 [Bacteroidales bacterium]|nr:hypothetical protein [Bacteroidales bacterium]
MLITKFSKHIFWSYNKNADLPDRIIIEQVSLYGEIKDLIILSKLYTKKQITETLQTLKNKYMKRINFIEKVIL